TDFTTDSVVHFLEQLGERKDAGAFTALLRDPESAASPCLLPKKVRSTAARLEATLSFTSSQQETYRAICRQRVTAIWGPPGTGKTHFLAGAIVGLALAHARAGLPFRVLVTAFTHAATENVLRKVVDRWRELRTPALCLELGKAKYWQGATPCAPV